MLLIHAIYLYNSLKWDTRPGNPAFLNMLILLKS